MKCIHVIASSAGPAFWSLSRAGGQCSDCTVARGQAVRFVQVWVHGLVQTLRAHVADLNAHFGAEELQNIPPASWPF